MDLIARVLSAFEDRYGGPAPRLFRAPGRVNLIGEHTDYNAGFVLPIAINYDTALAARARDDGIVRVYAADYGQSTVFAVERSIQYDGEQPWSNYLRGVAWVLQERGYPLLGFDGVVAGNIPRGAGLSSSASVEMAVGLALLRLAELDVDGLTLALAGQRAENEFVGVKCGVMDQFISALGQAGQALLIDCRSLSYRAVPLPEHVTVIVVDSGLRRGLVASEYNQRRQECEAAAAHFGVRALRDVDRAAFGAREPELSPLVGRRARHVISENERTLAAAEALVAGDLARMGQLMAASHVSMRDDFEISTPEIDVLVEIVRGVEGVYGARLTGGGFGGCIVALAPSDVVAAVEAAIAKDYTAATGQVAAVYRCRASDGASEGAVGFGD